MTYFGHSDRGKLEKVIITSPESKNNQPLSLLNLNGSMDADVGNLFNSLNYVTNLNGSNQNDTGSNPFVSFGTNGNTTNPFQLSNPFLPSNPFRDEDSIDGEMLKNGENMETTPIVPKEVSISNSRCMFLVNSGQVFFIPTVLTHNCPEGKSREDI